MKLITTALFLALLANAEQELNLSFLKGLEAKASEATDINLGPEQLKLMMGFSGDGAKDLQQLGKLIERVQVKSFEFDKEGAYSLADVEGLRNQIKTGDFVPLISVKEKKGFTEIAIRKGADGTSRGFIIISAEPRELTIVNIVGPIDMQNLGKLAGKFGIPNVNLGGSNSKSRGEGGKKDDDEN